MKKLFKAMLIGSALAGAVVPQITQDANRSTLERRAINEMRSQKRRKSKDHIGGLPLITEHFPNPPGLTPKQYGILYGTGASRKSRKNMLLVSKRAKKRAKK